MQCRRPDALPKAKQSKMLWYLKVIHNEVTSPNLVLPFRLFYSPSPLL